MPNTPFFSSLYYEPPKEEKEVSIMNTHYEVYPYELGECKNLEKALSIWIDAEYRYDPMGYYICDDRLYVPRGYNVKLLETQMNSRAFIKYESEIKSSRLPKWEMLSPPRNQLQVDSISFLSNTGKFKFLDSAHQQALILDTGDGKTYSTISAILNLRMKAIIITHQDKIKEQWINTLLKMTNVPAKSIVNISGTDVVERIMKGKQVAGHIYFVNHQTLTSYARTHGWPAVKKFFEKLHVGVKVFDEAHLSFKNVLRVDMFANTKKTFYLTANFERSDSKEAKLFKKCFSSVVKYGNEPTETEEKRKHIIYVPVLYRSNPTDTQIASTMNSYGFSVLNFSRYALHDDRDQTQIENFFIVFDKASELEGKILVTVPKIADTEFIQSLISEHCRGQGKKIVTINSSNTKEVNEEAKSADIICSTIRSCGTGVDIPGLRCIINLEPFSSPIVCNQLPGRLREYAKDKDTYFFDLVDIAFSTCERQYKTRVSHLKKKCKAIQIWRL